MSLHYIRAPHRAATCRRRGRPSGHPAAAAIVLALVVGATALLPWGIAGGEVAGAVTAAPAVPPAHVCGNAGILDGPVSPPPGAVTVRPGQNLGDATRANPAGSTFWLAPGIHSLGSSEFGQVIPRDGNTYVGAPGAVLDGSMVNRYAFTQKARDVTIKHLTIKGFLAPGNEGVVNHDFGSGWVIERNTIAYNGGAGVMLGDNNRLTYNCLADNSQYGFQGFGSGLTVDHNEIARNNTYDYETNVPGCGCSGGAKFWSAGPAVVTNNYVHDNHNVGLWADNNNVGFLFEGNYISGNRSHGIFYETSYNFRIVNNTFKRNAIPQGKEFQARNDSFPVGAIYLSESGGDPRVNGGVYATSEIIGNVFDDNWAGVVMWENADRFGHDGSANTSKGYTTLVIDPTGTHGSRLSEKCGPGVINSELNHSDCRWKTQNVWVTNNDFRMDKAAIGCTTARCGQQGMFSNYGTYPEWSPYKGRTVQAAIAFNQGNRFSNNRYLGDWRFDPYEAVGNSRTWSEWTAAPYNQDGGSTLNGNAAPPGAAPSVPASPVPPAPVQPLPTPGVPAPPPAASLPAPGSPPPAGPVRSGYWLLSSGGHVYPFGDAGAHGDAAAAIGAAGSGVVAVDIEGTPSGLGYWAVDSSGSVFTYGDAPYLGGVAVGALSGGERVTSLSATPSAGNGYWLFTDKGRVLSFGQAPHFGDMYGKQLNGPVLDSIPTMTGNGYYMVASDGGIFAFGDAVFHGSMGGERLNAPVASLVPDSDRHGYWLVASDGGVFAFDASFRGSMGGTPLNKPITGMVRYGDGYVMVATDGGVFNFSDNPFAGSLGATPPARPIVAVAALLR